MHPPPYKHPPKSSLPLGPISYPAFFEERGNPAGKGVYGTVCHPAFGLPYNSGSNRPALITWEGLFLGSQPWYKSFLKSHFRIIPPCFPVLVFRLNPQRSRPTCKNSCIDCGPHQRVSTREGPCGRRKFRHFGSLSTSQHSPWAAGAQTNFKK